MAPAYGWANVCKKFPCVALGILLVAACGHVSAVDEETFLQAFPFIRDDATSVTEVLNRLGEPDHRYEEGRIISYSGTCGSGHWQNLEGKGCGSKDQYSLMLVFGPDGVLQRHSFVRER